MTTQCAGAVSVFSVEQIGQMHQAALDILQEQGVWVQHAQARKALAEYDGVQVAGEQVRIEAEVVSRCVPVPYGPGRPRVGGGMRPGTGGYCQNVLDPETGEIRPARLKDLVAALKLVDSYDAEGAAPLTPTELPQALQEVALYRFGFEHARNVYGEVMTSSAAIDIIFEMCNVMDVPFRHWVYATSPLRIDHNDLETVRRFGPKGAGVWVCTMGIAGMTVPLPLAGAYTQSIAELLGTMTVVKLFVPETQVLGGEVFLSSMDMRTANFSFAAPETALMNVANLQIADYFGFEMRREAWAHTAAKEPGVQAGCERATKMLFAGLMGAEYVTSLGMLSNDEVFSPEQWVIDMEILGYVNRVLQGIPFSEDQLCRSAIREIGSQGEYLTHDSTLLNWRDVWRGEIFDYQPLRSWQQAGQEGVRDRAREIARQRVAEHSYRLDDDTVGELERLYAKAARP